MADEMVEGPAWTYSGLNESAGLYPLRVEPAVGRLVERLLPGVTTTTTGGRYYGLHTLAWSVAESEGLEVDRAEDLVRRCEVVLAAASWGHAQSDAHRRRVPEAHGLGKIGNFIDQAGSLDLAKAAAPGGYTVRISGAGDAAGIVLVEAYDSTLSDAFLVSTPRLINVSALTRVGTDSDILIAGFSVAGATPSSASPFATAWATASPDVLSWNFGLSASAIPSF